MLHVEEFERFYEDIQPGLLRFVSARVRDPHAAADLVQEIYAKAFRNIERYDTARPFSTWIYAIARNACVDFLRRRLRDPLSGVAPNAPAPPPDLDALPARGDWDPASAAERKDLVDIAREELEKLPDLRRAAVEMKVLEGLTFREVAEALDTPLGTVAFWVRESLEAIAARLRHLR
ncbi:MAG TPA: RNA polymerase sigma factor [Planctomycetota bacterium]|nr:RNA polymerase sigma factor [Planctomycetota bacterium]